MIAAHVDARFVILGTDGFGRSDTRSQLRRFFEVDRHQIVLAALDALSQTGTLPRSGLGDAMRKYAIDPQSPAPWTI